VQHCYAIIWALAAIIGKHPTDYSATTYQKLACTERQWFLVLHLGYWMGNAMASTQDHSIGHLDGQICNGWCHYHHLKFSVNGASTISVLHHWYSKHCATMRTHHQCIGRRYWHNRSWQYHYHLVELNINGAWTIFGLACWIIYGQLNAIDPQTTDRLPLWAQMLVMISHPPPTNEHLSSVINGCGGSVSYTAMNCIALFLNWV